MVMRILVLVGLMLLSSVTFAKGLSAEVDRAQLGLGEQLELTLTLSGVRGQRPDTSELLKDFSIDRQSQSSNMQIINGIVSQEVRWVFLLTPSRKGKLTIPRFKADRFSSDEIDILVTDMPVAQSTSDDVLMEVELNPESPYVNSQLAYIQRLYYSRPLVDNASISSPKLSKGDADVQFWGSSDPRHVTHNNRPYRLIERYYIIYPRKSGVLEFEPSVFNGSLARSRQRNDFQMNGFRRGARVSAYSAKASVEIKAKPASYPSEDWLPASRVTLSMNFSQPIETLKVGEPLTVTIALIAEGLKAEVLPEVLLDLPDAVKSYPEKPSFQTDKVTNGMVGLRQEKVVLIANEAGEYRIPEVSIPWWSTTEDELQFAKLDAVVLKVTGASAPMALNSLPQAGAGQSVSESPSAGSEEEVQQKSAEGAIESEGVEQSVNAITVSSGSWGLKFYQDNQKSLLIGFFLVVGLGAIGLFWRRLRKARLSSSKYQQQVSSVEVMNVLEVACKDNDLKAAMAALPTWAKSVGILPSTLAGIESSGDDQLHLAIREMTAASYSPTPSIWRGELLLKAVKQYGSASKVTRSKMSGMSPLHPV